MEELKGCLAFAKFTETNFAKYSNMSSTTSSLLLWRSLFWGPATRLWRRCLIALFLRGSALDRNYVKWLDSSFLWK
jgi:hypothetical protein